jgi:hypothetical protein
MTVNIDLMTLLIFLGVALIDAKLWKMLKAQRDHHHRVEMLLLEIRDKAASK